MQIKQMLVYFHISVMQIMTMIQLLVFLELYVEMHRTDLTLQTDGVLSGLFLDVGT